MFFRSNDKSSSIDRKRIEAAMPPREEKVEDTILQKNIRTLLLEVKDLAQLQRIVINQSNIFDIRKCILQSQEQERLNRHNMGFAVDLILDSML
mmetsp:Transcript_8484/g.12991  ORF Transcript_8484/g.12991 Transcript_8484/m.12991 type:complete len:94 (+) Transcript_8484:2543-2824(+)